MIEVASCKLPYFSEICNCIYNLKIHLIKFPLLLLLLLLLLLPTRRNLSKWGIMSNSDCSFCLKPETLLHVVAGCQSYLPRFTWRHDSVLNFIAQTLQPVSNSDLFVDLPGFKSPSVISSDTFRPDLLLSISNDHLYILELSVGFESNLQTNVDRKKERYKDLVVQQREHYRSVKLVNLSISSLGVFSKECDAFFFNKELLLRVCMKLINKCAGESSHSSTMS